MARKEYPNKKLRKRGQRQKEIGVAYLFFIFHILITCRGFHQLCLRNRVR